MADNISHLSETTFDETVMGSSTPVLVDFWAEWCGPCRMIAPILEELATEKADSLQIAKVNVDDYSALARRYEVMSIPTLILFKDGQPAKKIIGARGKSQLLAEIGDLL